MRSGLGKPDLTKKQTFILITKSFPGFGMDVHPEVENNDSSFPDANPLPTQKTIQKTN
jgi:hypothetical protein